VFGVCAVTISPALFTSASQTWNTPKVVLDCVRAFDDIHLDPCSNADSIVNATEEWRIERGEDGLARSWFLRSLIYVNPPYDELEAWAAKMAKEVDLGAEIIACIPARTETVAFQKYILPNCSAICFWRGRMRFGVGPAEGSRQVAMFGVDAPPQATGDNTAPFPSCLPYFGTRVERFARAFADVGRVVTVL
jgi:hypothetical protein